MTLTKTKINNKKRTVSNHKKNELHYFWPYIPLIAMMIIGYSVIKIIHYNQIITSNQTITAQSLLTQINQVRQKNHLQTLQVTNHLNQLAKSVNQVIINHQENLTALNSSPQINVSYGLNHTQTIVKSWQTTTAHQSLFQAATKQIGLNIQQINHHYLISAIGASSQNINITFRVNPSPQQPSKAKPVSIIYELTNGFMANSYLAIMIGLLIIVFVFRHFLFLKKTFWNGEQLIIKHLWIDFVIILLIIISIFLMQSIGFVL